MNRVEGILLWWVKKIQPNLTYHISPTQLKGRVELWAGQFFYYYNYLIEQKKYITLVT